MTPDAGPHSFDRARDRVVPTSIHGHWLNGESATIILKHPTLIVAIKSNCDGCVAFVNSTLEELNGQPVIIVSATDDLEGEWVNARRQILVAPEFLEALGVKWPPFYLLIDPAAGRVVTEGVVFGPGQVANEIALHRR